MKANQRYWIQVLNKGFGNWIDYVGLAQRMTLGKALKYLGATKKDSPGLKFRLIVRTDAVLYVG